MVFSELRIEGLERKGERQRERQGEGMRAWLQEQRRAARARRHVGHATDLRREQRGGRRPPGGLALCSRTAYAADS